MGWIGPKACVREALESNKARQTRDGRFYVRTSATLIAPVLAAFDGPREDCVIPEDVLFWGPRGWEPMVPILQGGVRVKVV